MRLSLGAPILATFLITEIRFMSAIKQQFDEAFAKHERGELGEAAQLYRTILDHEPNHADTLHMLGVLAQQMKKPALALELIDRALEQNPHLPLALYNRAIVLRLLNRTEEALKSAEEATRLDPHLLGAWDIAGALLREMERYDDACISYAKALELQPDDVRLLSNYTVLLLGLGDLPKAYKTAIRTHQLDKNSTPLPLGNILQAAGYPEKAIPHFQKTYELLPHFKEAKLNEAMARLQIGDFEKGFELWEARPDTKECFQKIPLWKGEKVQHLLLHEDQGMGDALQCMRYLSLMEERAEKITAQLTGHLKELLSFSFPEIEIITLDDPVPKADARAQLMSLPHIFKTRIDKIPAPIPYLKTKERWSSPWRQKLEAISKPLIGVVWAGNLNNRNDKNRTIAFKNLLPLFEKFAAHFISLQKDRENDQAELKSYNILNAGPRLGHFGDTAGLINELDLLITVDTAVAHLAGAMGKPTWLLLPYNSEWRWMYGREDSPWYPSLRLFRQPAPHDWGSVIKTVALELEKLIKGDLSVLEPKPWLGPPLKQHPAAIPLPD